MSPANYVNAPLAADADPRSRAWELKDACYAAWSSDPQRSVLTAAALRDLLESLAGADPGLRLEVEALAAWTDGIGQVTQGRMEAALAGFDRAAELFRAIGEAGHAAETQVPKIMALTILGRHAQAAECAESTQREFVALGNVRAAGKVSLNLGSLKMRRDAYAEAAQHYRGAAVLFARVGDHEHSVMADAGLADALTALGDFGEAARMYARASMRALTHGFPVLEVMIVEAVALLELARGHYRDALDGFERSRRRYEELAMPQHLAIAEKQLADAYLELRLLPEALDLLDTAVRRFAELDMPDDQAWALTQRGRTLALLRRPAQAAESLLGAAQLFALQGSRVGEAAVALVRAELALAANDGALALMLARHAAAAFEAAGQAGGREHAHIVAAQALLQTSRVGEAGERFAGALELARELHLLPLQVRALTGQGLVAQCWGDRAAAEKAFEQAIELFEELRRALPGDDIRSAFLADHLRPYHELLRLAVQDAGLTDARSGPEVLRRLDRFRARALGDRLTQGGVARPDVGADELRARLNWLYRRGQREHEEAGPSETLNELIRRTELELLERARRQRLTAGLPAAGQEPPLDLNALQSGLAAGDALVEYGVIDDELFACVVTADSVTLQRQVARWTETLEALRSLRFQIETLRFGEAPVASHMPLLTRRALARLAQLHTMIWAPLVPLLGDCRRVLVVPHGQLGTLPFAALYDGRQVLAERHQIALAPSARVALHGLRRAPGPARRVLALGESSQLPHAAHEARFVASLFAEGTALIDQQATLAALAEGCAGADVLHMACHAQFRDDNPMFSALHLGDGLLTAEAAERLTLPPGIVVLSACDTALSGQDAGDDRVGLVRAFLVAGAARVMASLWPVDDAVTANFMARFYAALCRGEAPASALRRAQTGLMQDRPHPFNWAAFTLYGGW